MYVSVELTQRVPKVEQGEQASGHRGLNGFFGEENQRPGRSDSMAMCLLRSAILTMCTGRRGSRLRRQLALSRYHFRHRGLQRAVCPISPFKVCR